MSSIFSKFRCSNLKLLIVFFQLLREHLRALKYSFSGLLPRPMYVPSYLEKFEKFTNVTLNRKLCSVFVNKTELARAGCHAVEFYSPVNQNITKVVMASKCVFFLRQLN